MAYTKQTWTDGTSIANAERLNHIEDGIYENSKDNVYSTDETDTGKVWVDGKKIYRKVIYYTLEQETGYPEFNTGITNADYVNMNITRYYGDNGGTYYVSMLSSFSGYFNKTNGKITFIQEGSGVISGIGLYEFTIEYTKTTD